MNDKAGSQEIRAPASLNGDMAHRAVMRTPEIEWQASPSGTVWRKRLHLVGDAESGQVTSVVRYEPGAAFPIHDHPDGEEIFVLEGVFSDEHGDWPAGTHLLNPEGFRHAPFSRDGCVLFVKLRQYAGAQRVYQKIDTHAMDWQCTNSEGIETKLLYEESAFPDVTRLERWASGTTWKTDPLNGGCEIFVIAGEIYDSEGVYGVGTWIRLPNAAGIELISEQGCVLYIKRGALPTLRTIADPPSERLAIRN